MDDEKKVVYKLHKEILPSERAEIRKRRLRNLLVVFLCLLFLTIGLAVGYLADRVAGFRGNTPATYSKFDELLADFDKYYLYKDNYEDLKAALEDKAYYGMTSFADDPYTSYMSYEELDSFVSGIDMNYVGIGVQYYNSDGIAQITRVFRHSPAEDAGLLPGDILRSVDGFSIEGLESDEIKERVIGKEGSQVVIGVLRAGEELEIPVIRGQVDSTVYAYAQDDYVVMELMSFGDGTANECINYLDDFTDYSKIIIDLRDNGGGFQDSVQEVAGLFLGENKVVMNQTYNNGQTVEFDTIVRKYYPNFEKIVILTNGSTASAAEVLTICLRENCEDVTIVGEKTYGKGVVQTSFYLRDGSALKITSSKWTSPNGVWIEKKGIMPDETVKLHDIFYETVFSMPEEEQYEYDCVSVFVRTTELALDYLGYDVNRTDGYFDRSLERELMSFQRSVGNEATGILDKNTYDDIISMVSFTYSNVADKDPQMNRAIEIIEEN